MILGIIALLNKISEGSMNKYIDSFDAVAYEDRLEPSLDGHGNYYFTTDGDFKVMHLTDIHIVGSIFTSGKDKKALNAVAAMVSAEKPDLVVITGDISFAVPYLGTVNNAYAHGYFIRLMERLGVYWTVTFGNHDSEKYNFHNRAAVAAMYSDEALERCLFSAGPADIYGECNHVINVKNTLGAVTRSFIMIDTNAYTDNDPLGLGWEYDHIKEDQIEWYRGVIGLYTKENEAILGSNESATPPSMLFMHIPIREVKAAYDEYIEAERSDTDNVKYLGGNDGEDDQVVYCPENDEEMFETVLELGSTDAMFYGHDHLNNFVLEYKGVTLSYGHSIDYSAYFGIAKKGYQRGCSVVLCASDGSFTVTHENYYQDKYEPLYEKEKVDMTK